MREQEILVSGTAKVLQGGLIRGKRLRTVREVYTRYGIVTLARGRHTDTQPSKSTLGVVYCSHIENIICKHSFGFYSPSKWGQKSSKYVKLPKIPHLCRIYKSAISFRLKSEGMGQVHDFWSLFRFFFKPPPWTAPTMGVLCQASLSVSLGHSRTSKT